MKNGQTQSGPEERLRMQMFWDRNEWGCYSIAPGMSVRLEAFREPGLYGWLGVLWIKRYIPTGGDYFRNKYGVRIIDIKSTIESLLQFQERKRVYEAIHVVVFFAFLLFFIWQLVSGRTNGIAFVIAIQEIDTLKTTEQPY